MSKILKLRRGTVSTMSGAKKNTVLAAGEIFAECPSTGIGTGAGKLKMGDGVTTYENLPYFLEAANLNTSAVNVTSNSQTTVANALNDVSTGNTLPTMIGALKRAVSLIDSTITTQFDENDSTHNTLGYRVASLEDYTGKNDTTLNSITSRVGALETSFPAGCNTIVSAVTAKGQTPASNSPSDIATAISNISTGPDLSILSKSSYTENEFLNKVSVADWFDNNIHNVFIGKKVRLTHSTKSVDWWIIGANHDGTTYTFDLWSSVSMYDSQQFGSSQTYSSSTVRTTINNMVTGFSSAVQGRMQTMSVLSNGSTLNDKVKILSLTEMGITTGNYHPGTEGNTYSNYFTSGRSTEQTYADLIRYNSSGSAVHYWTRSRNTNNASFVWIVVNGGYVGNNGYGNSYSLLPAIRIGVAS